MSNAIIETTTAGERATPSQHPGACATACPPPAADSAESLAAAANASTGPRTETGKAVSSRNAVKHNLCSQRLTGTDLEELNAIRARLNDEWEPSTETERMLLHQMALSQWRMDRALSLEMSAFDDDHIDPQLLALALRYRTTAERSFYKALSELQRLRKSIQEDAVRQQKIDEQDREAEVTAALDRLCFAPIAAAPQFVSQNPHPAAMKSQSGSQISAREGGL